jgi:hypothetical protein
MLDFSVNTQRPALLAKTVINRYVIEPKGFCMLSECMVKHKSQSTKGFLTINFSVASAAHRI